MVASAPAFTYACTIWPIAAALARIADEAEGLGRTTAHNRRRVVQGRAHCRRGVRTPHEAEGERGHLAHFGFRVAGHQRRQRSDRFGELDASGAKRRATPDPGVWVLQHRDQVGRHRRRLVGRLRLLLLFLALGLRHGHGLLHRVAQHPLIFEAQNPRQLLLVTRAGDGRRRPGDGGRGRRRQQQGQHDARAVEGVHVDEISVCRSVARAMRSCSTATPMPGPSEGTGTVPSGLTSIGGSMRSSA